MNERLLAVVAAGLASCALADDQLPAISGTVKQHNAFPSKLVAPRNVHVWLPPSYDKQSSQRFPVVYMHDGQNLFDPKTSFLKIDWGVDEAMTKLIEEGKTAGAIIVAVWNTPRRVQEYLPTKMITSLNDARKKESLEKTIRQSARFRAEDWIADRYLKFLVSELKPFIDKEYRTKPDRANTFVMGSSAGAMISLYAISEYPEVFGGAGCVSTHWPLADGLLIDYIKDKLPDPATHKIYFDFGTETIDKGYEPYQEKMDKIMEARGYVRGKNWLTRKFQGEEHSERSWRKRVHIPLEFLLSSNSVNRSR